MADAAAELEEGGVVRTLKDLFAGAAGGIAQVLLGEFERLFLGIAVLRRYY
jgi:solute carrier family 25 carnitine/acylcarnitine transporter 20/29